MSEPRAPFPSPRSPADRRGGGLLRGLLLLGISLLVHGIGVALLLIYWPVFFPPPPEVEEVRAVTLIDEELDPAAVADPSLSPPDEAAEEEPPPEEEKPPPELKGQLVDTPPPKEEKIPEKAEYLAEHNNAVPEETRSRDLRVNPEVLSAEFSESDKLQFEEAQDLNITEPSTGAQVGGDPFNPGKDGRLAALPSPYALTNKDGMEKPVPASSTTQSLAGSPNNDLLHERMGRAVNLNTYEMLGANYLNRIRRLVNFYWTQNVDNLPSSVRFSRPRYATVVEVVLDGQGAVLNIEITEESGCEPLDMAVVEAFRLAGPFPNPPAQLIAKDGKVYLPTMTWEVQLGMARAPYMGVDPRAGVQFPGILKAPR